jgi:hypothetical protein
MRKNETELIFIYTKSSNICLSKFFLVKHKIRGQHPLSFPFTKIILFNSYFAHKRSPRNMTSPSFWATFGTFGQVVELDKERIGLERPIVFNQDISSLIHGPLPSKYVKCPSSPPNRSHR